MTFYFLDVCLRRGHGAKPPDTTILTPYILCSYRMYVRTEYEWFGQSRGEGEHTGEIRYLVFLAYLHEDGVGDC